MARTFCNDTERLVQLATGSIRTPGDGAIYDLPMYVIVPAGTINPKTGQAPCEVETFDDIAAMLLPMFKEYVEGMEAIIAERAGALA